MNLWPNRLIRDGQLPPDKRLTTTNVKKYYEPQPEGHKLLDSGLLGPVRLMAADRKVSRIETPTRHEQTIHGSPFRATHHDMVSREHG